MKKNLLLLFIMFCGLWGNAQTTCNASFSTTITGFTATFTPAMIGDSINSQHQWLFGDNTPVSMVVTPSHTYATPGVYTVRHIFSRYNPNVVCRDTVYSQVIIAPTTICNLQSYFTYVRDSINHRKYYFTNQTGGFLPTDSIRWNFGDGTPFSYAVNPDHIYAAAGTYNVCIRVKRTMPAGTAPCISEYCKVLVVDSVASCNLQAYFSHQYDAVNRKKVYFTNQTAGFLPTDSIRWNFGDGTLVSYAVNPNHTYAAAGIYNVCIRVKRNSTTGPNVCISEYCKQVIIDSIPPCNLQANFNYQQSPSNLNNVYFVNQTVNFLPTDSIRWNFGDGTPFSYVVNPNHVYANAGTYNVCIRVKRTYNNSTPPCISEYCRQVVINPTTVCNYVVDFSSRVDSLNNRKVFFTNLSTQIAGATATWTFGDGTSSNTWNAEHTYANIGNYNVCLKVTYNNTCIKDKCRVIQLVPNTNTCILQPYPNPASSIVNASVSLTAPTLITTRIFNSSNVVVRLVQQTGVIGFNTVSVNVSTLPAGVYRMIINYGNRECRGTFLKVN